MDLSVLIVTYNSARLIDNLLTQLHSQLKNMNAEIVIVDNHSRDETVSVVANRHPWVNLVESPVNLGFAAGNNLAAKHARGRVLLLLNPDAVPSEGTLIRGLALLAEHCNVGLAGGQLHGADGSWQPSARMFPTLLDEFFSLSGLAARFPKSRLFARLDRRWADPNESAIVDWIPGASVFIPAAVFRHMHGFDERFFMYYEEVDLCKRMAREGYAIHYWPSLQTTHIGGESAKTVDQARISKSGAQLESWRMRSAFLFYRKHRGVLGAGGLLILEWGWVKLRQLKATWRGDKERAKDFEIHCNQLAQAWVDTDGGRSSPVIPW